MGVLVKNQTNKAHNGRYNLTSLGSESTPWVLTKCGLCDEADEIPGAYVFVQNGTANKGTGWIQVVANPDTFVVGTDNIDVFQFSGAGTFTAGNGLTLTGTEFAIDTTVVATNSYVDTEIGNIDFVSTFNETTDATLAGITIDEVAYSAVTRLQVTSSGTSAYLFNNQYSGNNPTLSAIAGTTIAFNLNVPGHPFLIRYQGANYDTGLIHVSTTGVVTTGADAQGKTSGTLYWQLPANISGNYGYLCSIHGSMIGTIKVVSDESDDQVILAGQIFG
jgi:plastocyanin